MTNRTQKKTFRVDLHYGLPGGQAPAPLRTYTGPAAAAAVAAACIERTAETPFLFKEPWLTFSFDPTPTAEHRAAITAAVQDAFPAPEWEKLEDGWDGERVAIDKAFQPGFSLHPEDCIENSIAGFWYDDATFLFVSFDLSEPFIEGAGVSASHWHPSSRCSGSWHDQYTIVAPRLASTYRLNDEDGYYIGFEPVDTSTAKYVADALESAVRSWCLFGAEYHLLDAHFLGFTEGSIDELPDTENPGYTIEDFNINATAKVLKELNSRHLERMQEGAAAWLKNLEDIGEYSSIDTDSPMMQRLRELANTAQGEGQK
jgi:hypothetical protein